METRRGLLLLIPTGAPDLLSWVTWGQMEQRSPQTTGWDEAEPQANLLQEHPRKPSSTQQCTTRGAEAELFFPPTTPCSLAAPKQQNWGETHNSRAMDAVGGRNHSVQHSEVTTKVGVCQCCLSPWCHTAPCEGPSSFWDTTLALLIAQPGAQL